jgi:hypothetical protein
MMVDESDPTSRSGEGTGRCREEQTEEQTEAEGGVIRSQHDAAFEGPGGCVASAQTSVEARHHPHQVTAEMDADTASGISKMLCTSLTFHTHRLIFRVSYALTNFGSCGGLLLPNFRPCEMSVILRWFTLTRTSSQVPCRPDTHSSPRFR